MIKDATRIDGLLTLYQKDDKVWIELQPADFGKLFFLSPKIARGIGEGRVFGGTMIGRDGSFGRSQVVAFRKLHNQVHLLARNQQYLADAGTPQARAVDAAFSDSLLGSVPLASQAHPDRKSVLIEASPLFLGDMLGIGSILQRAYRQSYSLDRSNTGFASVRGLPDQVVFNVQAHFATASLATPTPGAPPGAPVPSVPGTLPDARSMFIGLYYSLAKLPDQVMRPRASDPRVGYFTTAVNNFSTDIKVSPRQRFVNRWRLEKKEPAAELSEPVKPIVFWIDRTVPLAYRDAVTRGILEWNKAFEKIGFKHAVQARQQPDDASFDTLDVGVASVRFITSAEAAFDGSGPSVTDPRSGEIPGCRHRHRRQRRAQHAWPAHAGLQPRRCHGSRRQGRPGRVDAVWQPRAAGRPAGRAAPACRWRLVRLRCACGRAVRLCAGRARIARRHCARQPRGPGLRGGAHLCHHHPRGGPRAGAAPQLPGLARLHAGATRRPGLHGRQWHGRLGDGLFGAQPAAAGRALRAPWRGAPQRPGALRLLGHRVRLQAHRRGRRGR
ncbi:MAG: DUF5117 domain-containing protein [Ideonella sp.]|nr:DUF5117 domain-containing protein [Ideonella sp.]